MDTWQSIQQTICAAAQQTRLPSTTSTHASSGIRIMLELHVFLESDLEQLENTDFPPPRLAIKSHSDYYVKKADEWIN